MKLLGRYSSASRGVSMRDVTIAVVGGILWCGWFFRMWYGHGAFDGRGDPIGGDFITFFAAGRAVVLGNSARLYQEEYMRGLQAHLLGGDPGGYLFYFNPPQLALLFGPLSFLPYVAAFGVWTGINLVALVWALRLLDLRGQRILIGVAAWYPVFAAFSFGQTSIISLWVTTACIFLWRQGRNYQSGFLLSCLFYKLYLVILLLVFFLGEGAGGRRALCAFFLGIGAWSLIGLGLMPAACLEFLSVARTVVSRQEFWLLHPAECSLDSLWFRLSTGSLLLTQALSWMIRLSVLGAYGVLVFRRVGSESVRCACAVLLGLLLFPHTMIYELTLLLIPFGLLWQAEEYRQMLRVWWPVAWLIGLVGPLLALWQQPWLPFGVNVTAAGLVGVAAAVLYREIRFCRGMGDHAVS